MAKICLLFDTDEDGELDCPAGHRDCTGEECSSYVPSSEDEIEPELARLMLDSFNNQN